MLQYKPTDHEVHWYLAVAYEHSNRILKAIGAYRNVLKYKGADPKISAKIQPFKIHDKSVNRWHGVQKEVS